MNALFTTVLDLDAELGGEPELLLGGGLGLYLKQEHLRTTGVRTRLPLDRLPPARTTQDIDLFLRAEVIASRDAVVRIRAALDALGFAAVENSKYLKFKRHIAGSEVLLDVMVGPLGAHETKVHVKDSRVRPKELGGAHGVHAFATVEALGIEINPMRLTLRGTRSNGLPASCDVLIPRAFPYALMKLGALRDRLHDTNKQMGRHHAMDLYRIVGMLTEEDAKASEQLARAYAGDPVIVEACRTIDELLAPTTGLGRIRLLEYQRFSRDPIPELDPDFLVAELRHILMPHPDDRPVS